MKNEYHEGLEVLAKFVAFGDEALPRSEPPNVLKEKPTPKDKVDETSKG